jgi:hypothetical protein
VTLCRSASSFPRRIESINHSMNNIFSARFLLEWFFSCDQSSSALFLPFVQR